MNEIWWGSNDRFWSYFVMGSIFRVTKTNSYLNTWKIHEVFLSSLVCYFVCTFVFYIVWSSVQSISLGIHLLFFFHDPLASVVWQAIGSWMQSNPSYVWPLPLLYVCQPSISTTFDGLIFLYFISLDTPWLIRILTTNRIHLSTLHIVQLSSNSSAVSLHVPLHGFNRSFFPVLHSMMFEHIPSFLSSLMSLHIPVMLSSFPLSITFYHFCGVSLSPLLW